jgi:hypothetical protein
VADSDQDGTTNLGGLPNAAVGDEPGTRNEVEATSIHSLIQAGTIHGDLYIRTATTEPAALRGAPTVGVPINQASDPFNLEIHRPIAFESRDELPILPRYVRRAHNETLARVVHRALAGESRMAVLVAGSSAGKTRACWEALTPLREAGGWRLWHPLSPTRAEALLEGLDRVRPHTVVWLNETQEYFNGAVRGDNAEQVVSKLRRLLTDHTRAPVLVLGTLWPEYRDALTQVSGSQVRQLLDGTVIHVPHAFTGTDLDALTDAARHDRRLAWAVDHAEDGQITQYLAGGPELLERLHAAPPAARAVILAAMDARNMGHRNALQLSLLEHAAPAYLTDAEWHQLDENWLEQALAYTGQSCKGALGPVVRSRPGHHRARPNRRQRDHGNTCRQPAGHSQGPAYRLADYLEHWAHTHRAEHIPPVGFWAAAGDHALPDDLRALADAAWARGLYRDATQLHKNATVQSDPHAAAILTKHLYGLHPDDQRPAHWAAAHTPLDNPDGVARLLKQLREIGADEQVTTLLARNPATHISLDNPHDVARLLGQWREVGADEQVAALAKCVARDTSFLNDPYNVAVLLEQLREAGADEQVTLLLARNPATHISLDNPDGVARLLKQLREIGADEQVTLLLARNPATHASLDNPDGVARLLKQLREVGAHEQITVLTERVARDVPVNDPYDVAVLLKQLREVGADDQIALLLARDPAAHVSFEDPDFVGLLLEQLREVGADDQVATVLARNPATHVSLDPPQYLAGLLKQLREMGAHEQVAVLTERAARDVPVNDPFDVVDLLEQLREAGADEQAAVVLARNPAAHASFSCPGDVAWLLARLRRIGAHEQVAVLLARNPAAHAFLGSRDEVAELLKQLREAGADEQAAALAERLPSMGMFDVFMGIGDHKTQFRFGREPDMTPAAFWTWDDIE